MRYVLLVSYDGTCFSGFQTQREERTVQGELERAATGIFGMETKIAGSGRTDAGVHAEGQVCHFNATTSIPPNKIAACFNAVLPPDLRVLKSAAAPDGFDCTRSAKRKTYAYSFYYARTELPLWERYSVRVKEKPDCAKMRAAANLLLGRHDFKAFCASGSSAKTSIREIFGVEINERISAQGTEYTITVCGNGFLYNMVRILVGELIAIGCGKEEQITAAFASGERKLLAKTMPAKGLKLMGAEYAAELFPAASEE